MGSYLVTLPLPEGLHVAKTSQDMRFKENHGLQNSPWAGKSYLATGLVNIDIDKA